MTVPHLSKKYDLLLSNKIIVTLIFLLSSFLAIAQDYPKPDTIYKDFHRYIDTNTDTDRVVMSPVEADSVAAGVDELSSNYFSHRSAFASDTFQLRHLPDSVITKMRQDDEFWYANAVLLKENEKKDKRNSSGKIPLIEQTWFQTFLWVLIIGSFSAFIIIYLANSNVMLFRRKPKSIAAATEEDVETNDIFAINYPAEIEKAIGRNNYRFAVRLMFLELLKRLSEKNIIQYAQDKTNLDYLMQLRTTNYYREFFRITRNYEYSWYGQFEISPEKFMVIKKDFEKFSSISDKL